MPENVDTTIIRLVDDKAARQQVERGLDSVIDKVGRVSKPLGELGTAAAGGVRRLRSEFQDGEQEVDRFATKTEGLIDTIERLNHTEATPRINVRTTGRQGNFLDSIDTTGRVGTQILSGLGQGEAANAAGLIGDIAGAFTTLNPAMLAVTATGVGLTAIFGQIQHSMQEAHDAAANYLALQGRVDELIAGGATRSDIQQTVDAQQRLLDTRQNERDTLQGYIDQHEDLQLSQREGKLTMVEFLQATDTFFQQVSEHTGGLITTVPQLEEALSQYDASIHDLSTTLLLNKNALDSTGVAANSAAALWQNIEDSIQGFINTGKELPDLFQQMGERALEVGKAAQELERERAAKITLQYDAQLDTLEALGKAQESVNKAQQAYNDSLSQQSAKIAEVNDKLTEQLTTAESNRLDALNKAERDAGDARLKALKNFQEAERKINAQYANDKLMAEGNRDALAAFQAKLAKEEQLQDQEHQLSEQEQEIEQSLRKQTQTIQDQYAKQVSTAQDNASKQIALTQRQGQAELALRQQTLSAAIVQLQNFQNAAIAIMNQLVTSTANMRYGANYGTPTTVMLPNGQTQPGYAVQYGMMNGRYQPIPAPQSSGGATLNLTVNGATQQMVNNASFQQATSVINGALQQIYGQSTPR